jgi:8-oxo-dGTP diphosphatase
MNIEQVFAAYRPLSEALDVRAKFCPRCGGLLEAVNSGGRDRLSCSCGFVLYRNPAPGVTVLVTEGDRFILCRRHGDSHIGGGLWCLPGGHIEWDESFLEAAVRETVEETGLRVEITSILSVTTNYLSPLLHSIVVVLGATPLSGDLSFDDEIEEVRWFSRDEPLPEMAFAADTHIIERYFANPGFGAPIDPRFAR